MFFPFLQNFKLSLSELKEGKKYTELSLPVIPKTDEEAERIKKRGEKTKEVLFGDLNKSVEKALEVFPSDDYLKEIQTFLLSKSFKSFNPKSKLTKLVLEVEEHIDFLGFENSLNLVLNEVAYESDNGSDGE